MRRGGNLPDLQKNGGNSFLAKMAGSESKFKSPVLNVSEVSADLEAEMISDFQKRDANTPIGIATQ
jgi:hypothetical protein